MAVGDRTRGTLGRWVQTTIKCHQGGIIEPVGPSGTWSIVTRPVHSVCVRHYASSPVMSLSVILTAAGPYELIHLSSNKAALLVLYVRGSVPHSLIIARFKSLFFSMLSFAFFLALHMTLSKRSTVIIHHPYGHMSGKRNVLGRSRHLPNSGLCPHIQSISFRGYKAL